MSSVTLWKAARNGDLAAASQHIIVADPNYKHAPENNTPLHVAILGGHEEMVSLLLEKAGANPSICDSYGDCPLHTAARQNSATIIDMLVQSGANVNAMNKSGRTALSIACLNGKMKSVEALLKSKADINMPLESAPVIAAAYRGHVDIVETLLTSGADTSKANVNRYTALHVASQEGHVECLSLLIPLSDLEASIDVGMTMLALACTMGHIDCARALINAGACVNSQRKDGSTTLHIASGKGQLQVVTELLKAGANIILQNTFGETLLMAASCKNHMHIVAELLKSECAPLNTNDLGLTALHMASQEGHIECLRLLLPVSNINSKTNSGDTPMMLACVSGQEHCLRELLYAGADTSLSNESGETVLDLACDNKRLPCALLVGTGGRINIKEAVEFLTQRNRLVRNCSTIKPIQKRPGYFE